MSLLRNFLPVLARTKMHHATSFLGLLIASGYHFENLFTMLNHDHKYRSRLGHLSL